MSTEMRPTEFAVSKILYETVRANNPQTLEQIYGDHKRLLLTRTRMVKIIDHLAGLGLVRCRADGKAVVIEAVR